jgi:hypothetical protein
MQIFTRRVLAFVAALALVLVSLAIANYIGWLRLKPEVSAVSWINDIPNYDAHLVNMHVRAMARVQTGASDSFLPIYDVQNPGFFLLVAELFVRAGATTPIPLQIFSMILFNIGALCFFFWVYVLFQDLVVATFGTVFLVLSKFFLFFPGVTHTMPYEFVFFNVTLLLFVLFLRNNKPGYLIASLVAMFMTCMNYWFYYMSSWIIMVGLWWQFRGRPRLRDAALLSAPPVCAALFTAIMVMSLMGGVRSGALRLADILVARLVDARISGGSWYPTQRFMSAADWISYPITIVRRLEWSYLFDPLWFFLAALWVLFLLSLHNRRAFVSAIILLAGSFSWYYVMFQHTHIHVFAGQYSFMAICPIFGLIVSETIFITRRAVARASMVSPALYDRLASPEMKASGGGSMRRMGFASAAAGLAMAALLLTVVSAAVWSNVRNTRDLIDQTVEVSRAVETKYQAAIQAICQQHAVVTLKDLQAASKDWGFVWLPHLITDTNRTPKCPG